ncbi:hypothetical protein PpBr36_08165 [Pyricularia pennisetigena]|uniref:hypothetical protein n=1 Tax=Pyricularia pennisetigena TaxID=1578925 RepID=UPI0011547587|nr:hypothetical protein PpBr36_08165 [Pyricularia pennisetigena]TLS24715.1 hypothetical protein PpBr36_08165 [Pyricularia pennisetigena]
MNGQTDAPAVPAADPALPPAQEKGRQGPARGNKELGTRGKGPRYTQHSAGNGVRKRLPPPPPSLLPSRPETIK